jgi:hypothetical protein
MERVLVRSTRSKATYNMSARITRVRHYDGLNANTGKAKFLYHRQNLDYVEKVLVLNGHNRNRPSIDPIGQVFIDLNLLNLSTIQQKVDASIAQSVEQQPCKL